MFKRIRDLDEPAFIAVHQDDTSPQSNGSPDNLVKPKSRKSALHLMRYGTSSSLRCEITAYG